MVIVQILNDQARIQNGQWKSSNRILEKNLQVFSDMSKVYTSDPYPDLTLAKQAVERLGGEIIKQDPKPEAPEGVIF